MELTKQDSLKAKGIAIVGMVMLHLFCRVENLPYTPWVWIGDTPLIYYLGLFGDICVPIYCFCSGYAHFLMWEQYRDRYHVFIPQKILRFLVNYWIVVVLFSVVGLIVGRGSVVPGSFSMFLGNVFLFRLSYNGAWWFVITYILLLVLSPVLVKVTRKLNPIVLLIISGSVYFLAYVFRFKVILDIKNEALAWIWQQTILFGTSQFLYMVGLVSRKGRWISKLRTFTKYDQKNTSRKHLVVILVFLPLAAFVCHCIEQSLIVAPLTATAVLVCLFCVHWPRFADKLLLFLGEHSTNIWLVHMFFYLSIFDGFVFIAKYPLFVFILMMNVSLISSWVINGIKKKIYQYIKRFVKGR